jgi:predicted nucleic acid-binding protein
MHTMAEVYATMTALPVKPPIPPEQAVLFIGEIRTRLALISLEEEEYYGVIQDAAERGLSSGRIYDALLLRCAAKTKAETIYTWNLKHFERVAPELTLRMRNP